MKDGFEVVNMHGSVSGIVPVPFIGENGNWYIGNHDTEVVAKGQNEKDVELAANLTTESEGKALDATMGRVLNKKIVDISDNLVFFDIMNSEKITNRSEHLMDGHLIYNKTFQTISYRMNLSAGIEVDETIAVLPANVPIKKVIHGATTIVFDENSISRATPRFSTDQRITFSAANIVKTTANVVMCGEIFVG